MLVSKNEVDKFMGELGHISKRSEKNIKYSSREQSLDGSFENGVVDNILGVLREIGEKQKIMAILSTKNYKKESRESR